MKIHAIRTGHVRVHERQRTGRGSGVLRFLNTLLDREWTEPLPIYAWAIEHPEGVIVVDSGETSRTSVPGYFPRWHPYYRLGVRMDVRREEEIDHGLRAVGIEPSDVRWVVLTHLHTDHAGGLRHFSESRILVSASEHRRAQGFMGRLRGYLPHRWPEWLTPEHPRFVPEPVGPFPRSFGLTRAGDVRLVPTPGHTEGHLSVVLEEGEHRIFLAGDTSYTQANLRAGAVDGVSSMGGGERVAAETLNRIRTLAQERPLVYLPSHDPEAEERLRGRIPVEEMVSCE